MPVPVYRCVEIKYCCDYLPERQAARASSQHASLLQAVRAEGHRADLVTILLGVSGTIYQDTLSALVSLGVSREASKTLCKALHRHAVSSLSSIYGAKRALDSAAPPPPPEPPPPP